MDVLAYHLIRAVMVRAALSKGLCPRQLSCKGALQAVNGFPPALVLALWYSPGCKIIALSTAYVNRSTFHYSEKRVQRCARPLRFLSTSLM